MSEIQPQLCYPAKDQYTCIQCKQRKFNCWADFENHHVQHVVQYNMKNLPVAKLVRLDSALLKSIEQSELMPKLECIKERISLPISPTASPEDGETTTLNTTSTSSCEEPSPIQSTSMNRESERGVDNILDPDFLEQLGIEISFLNQASAESQPNVIEAVVDDNAMVSSEKCSENSPLNEIAPSISPADSTVMNVAKGIVQVPDVNEGNENISEVQDDISEVDHGNVSDVERDEISEVDRETSEETSEEIFIISERPAPSHLESTSSSMLAIQSYKIIKVRK